MALRCLVRVPPGVSNKAAAVRHLGQGKVTTKGPRKTTASPLRPGCSGRPSYPGMGTLGRGQVEGPQEPGQLQVGSHGWQQLSLRALGLGTR